MGTMKVRCAVQGGTMVGVGDGNQPFAALAQSGAAQVGDAVFGHDEGDVAA